MSKNITPPFSKKRGEEMQFKILDFISHWKFRFRIFTLEIRH